MTTDMIKEIIFRDTEHLNIGDYWRFQQQVKTKDELKICSDKFKSVMEELCEQGYFEAQRDGMMVHYIVCKKLEEEQCV